MIGSSVEIDKIIDGFGLSSVLNEVELISSAKSVCS